MEVFEGSRAASGSKGCSTSLELAACSWEVFRCD